MTGAPLLAAAAPVQAHAALALLALPIGAAQLLGRKGTPMHRALGWAWAALMAAVGLGSFWIHDFGGWRGFTVLHALSAVMLASLALALAHARAGRVARHRRAMQGVFFGALCVAAGFTLWPGRVMHAVVFGG